MKVFVRQVVFANLDFFREAIESNLLSLLLGEVSFHQFHGI